MTRIGTISIGLLLCLTVISQTFAQEIEPLEEIADIIGRLKEELSKGIKGLDDWIGYTILLLIFVVWPLLGATKTNRVLAAVDPNGKSYI